MKKRQKQGGVVKSWKVWNRIPNKPDACDCEAVEGDIVMKIDQIWCLCQRRGEANNLVAFVQPGKWKDYLSSLRAIFDFCYRLATKFGIRYVRIAGKPGCNQFLDRLFPGDVVRNPELINGEVVRYMHFSDRAIKKFDILRHGKDKK